MFPIDSKVFSFKLVLLGATNVGKSSMAQRFVENTFSDYQATTIGAAFLTQTIVIDDCTVKFEIWDTAGQERYESLAPMYYRGASAAIVVYAINDVKSYERAKWWLKELKKKEGGKILVTLVGNKLDLSAQREVEPQVAKKYADDRGILFIETSAKTPINVKELFYEIARKLPQKRRVDTHRSIKLSDYNSDDKDGLITKTSGCCSK